MKQVDNNKITVFIDIDGTITPDCGHTIFPLAIETIQELSEKSNIFIWSAGGFNYCEEIVNKLNLEEFICGFMPKPEIVIDDLPMFASFIHKTWEPKWKQINRLIKFLRGNWVFDREILHKLNIKD